MVILGFLLGGTALILMLGFMVQFKSYQKTLRWILFALGALFVVHLWAGYFSVFASNLDEWFLFQRILQSLGMLITVASLALANRFLRDGDADAEWSWGTVRISLSAAATVGAVVGGVLIWFPGMLVVKGEPALVRFEGLGIFIPVLRVLVAIYVLYLLESTYRFSLDYQRRIARLSFIGLTCLSVFHLIFYANALLYRELPMHFAEASSVVYAVVYPVVLAGFLRYRLGSERISIPRDTMYTSATVFLTGAAFMGVALTVFIFQWLKLDFDYFERFLTGFTLCFLAVLVLGSGSMRRRISRFVNQQFYSRKYDYQDQFFRLHKTSMSGADVDTALTELVENMKYSVTVDDAYFFILDWQDGDFYQHENKEETTLRGLVISGDSPLPRMLAREGLPVDLLATDPEGQALRAAALEEPLVAQLRFNAIFPIFIGERLAGLLALQGGRTGKFDTEDLDLIAVFTNSIGDALFKNRVLKERIEQKQFESFHHVASFIIHDIKNQVATLSLLLKNAERNLANPSFQTSMLNSIKSCSSNLQNLIDRLSVAPKSQVLELSAHPLRPLLDEVVANSGLASLAGVAFELSGVDGDPLPMDRQSLFFVIRNLVNNALEAMGGRSAPGGVSRIAISFGPLRPAAPARLRELFGGGERFFSSYGGYILVEDSGAGMDKDFVQRRLFQPFATTKEKGVGIGLYQCKTLVEKMGGRILVHSELGKGTEFCVLLPSGG